VPVIAGVIVIFSTGELVGISCCVDVLVRVAVPLGVKSGVAWTVYDAVGVIPTVAVMVGVPLALTDVAVGLKEGVIVLVRVGLIVPLDVNVGV
jgi:hypothetical protein